MKILFLSGTLLRGAAERIARALLYYTEHEVRILSPGSFLLSKMFSRQEIPGAIHYCVAYPNHVHDCLEWADVIHCMNSTSLYSVYQSRYIGRKPIVLQIFGKWGPHREGQWRDEDWKYIKLTIIAEGWCRHPDLQDFSYDVLPMIFMFEQPPYFIFPIEDRKKVVSTSIARRTHCEATKGFHWMNHRLNRFKIPHDAIYKTPWEQCMLRKAQAWVGIDEIITPMFHFSGFEYLACGVPCFTRWDTHTEKVIKDVTGADTVPFMYSNKKSFISRIKRFFSYPIETYTEYSKNARAWMEKYYHPGEMIDRYDMLYKSL